MIFKNYIEFAEKYAFFNQKDHLLEKLEWNNFYKILRMKLKTKNHHIAVMVLAPFAGLEPATL